MYNKGYSIPILNFDFILEKPWGPAGPQGFVYGLMYDGIVCRQESQMFYICTLLELLLSYLACMCNCARTFHPLMNFDSSDLDPDILPIFGLNIILFFNVNV